MNGQRRCEIPIYIDANTHTPVIECYSVTRKKEILSLVTIWVELEGIILSEIRQKKTDMYNTTYIRTLKGETETRFVVPGAE